VIVIIILIVSREKLGSLFINVVSPLERTLRGLSPMYRDYISVGH